MLPGRFTLPVSQEKQLGDLVHETSGLLVDGPAGDLPDAAAALTESEGHTAETAESEESDQSDCSSQISTADLPSAPKECWRREGLRKWRGDWPQGKASSVDAPVERGDALCALGIPSPAEPQVSAVPSVTFKGVLRQLLQQLHGLQNLARQHPFWLHTTLSESFHLSACSKAHADAWLSLILQDIAGRSFVNIQALFEEAAALAVLRRQQQLRGEICDSTVDFSPWEEDISDSLTLPQPHLCVRCVSSPHASALWGDHLLRGHQKSGCVEDGKLKRREALLALKARADEKAQSNPDLEPLLKRLSSAMVGAVSGVEGSSLGSTSPRWRQLGFQSSDPRSDLRTGILALDCLVYMAEKYPLATSQMIREAQSNGIDYPFAVASINVTQHLARYFHLVKDAFGCPMDPASPRAVHRFAGCAAIGT
eukprot:s155_g46.t1